MVIDRFPIPRVQDLLATQEICSFHIKLDLSQAYQQVVLDKESQPLA